jgi:ABC-type dipeptide/oligopeptide/nickel transport system ATPase component
MATAVLIMGESGSGKSASLRNFAPNEISVFNITSKPLPFKQGKTKIPKIDNATYTDIANALAKPNKRAYVIDDAGYLLSFEMFKRATETGYTKFTEMAKNFFDMLDFINTQLPSDIIVYITMHTEDDSEMHKTKAKTIGKMIDQNLNLEGLFTIVLRAMQTEDGYKFITRDDRVSTAKSPMGMFESDTIDNDLKEVDRIIREYYDMKPLTDAKTPSKKTETKGE